MIHLTNSTSVERLARVRSCWQSEEESGTGTAYATSRTLRRSTTLSHTSEAYPLQSQTKLPNCAPVKCDDVTHTI